MDEPKKRVYNPKVETRLHRTDIKRLDDCFEAITMNIDNILAERSKIGEISLYDRTDKFEASFKDGKWLCGPVFDFDYLERYFLPITDEAEVTRLMNEARSILGKPLQVQESLKQQQNPGAKSA